MPEDFSGGVNQSSGTSESRGMRLLITTITTIIIITVTITTTTTRVRAIAEQCDKEETPPEKCST